MDAVGLDFRRVGEAGQLDDLQQHIDLPRHAGCDVAADKPVDLAFQLRLIVNDTVHGKQLVMETLHGVEREEVVRKDRLNDFPFFINPKKRLLLLRAFLFLCQL